MKGVTVNYKLKSNFYKLTVDDKEL